METSRVKIYDLTSEEEEAIRIVRGIIEELYDDDFFEYEPESWDLIISNPPFHNKRAFFERALSFGKPFALLMTITWLNDATPKKLFGDKMEILMFDRRICFEGQGVRPNFSSAYFCKDFLPKQIICREIKR